ncbi:hypothetical protein Pmani_038768 [Petrolisthes manimaculis]|uniref:Uncharacterized protein n=1 Tax=Petrolisthes manimaculis TaxID=1843537 RepID=A0AAE1NDR4_9EUCA|nr:hypothetical protein Pmani_038768 [Petrolisthes manimaculis]
MGEMVVVVEMMGKKVISNVGCEGEDGEDGEDCSGCGEDGGNGSGCGEDGSNGEHWPPSVIVRPSYELLIRWRADRFINTTLVPASLKLTVPYPNIGSSFLP